MIMMTTTKTWTTVVVVVAAPATVPGPVIMVVPMVVVDDDVVAWSRVGPRGPVKENPVGVVEFPQFIRRQLPNATPFANAVRSAQRRRSSSSLH